MNAERIQVDVLMAPAVISLVVICATAMMAISVRLMARVVKVGLRGV